MAEMETLYKQTNKLTLEIQGLLNRLATSRGGDANDIENQIESNLQTIGTNCERLNILVNKEPAHRRQNSKMKVDQLIYDQRHLEAALRNYRQKQMLQKKEEQEREELLQRKFTANNGDTSIMIDHALQHNSSLHNASQGVDDLLGSGSSILTNLREQRITLKGVHKRILDIASTLGLSNTLIRLIDKRGTQDKWIVFGGIIVTCIIMFLVVKYLT
ncbi:Golgi SNAP receptor complex member 2-like [Paramuricea clavata]|nr:Golgi SNAP receptor complex member 2-like [Paramuricea clavata]